MLHRVHFNSRVVVSCPTCAAEALENARNVWGGASFAKYFEQEYLRQAVVNGETFLKAAFFSGATSRLPPGFPATQQFAEGFFSALKSSLEVNNQHNSATQMLDGIETVCKQFIHTPGYEHSLIGPHQELRGVPPTPTERSEDLVDGLGRSVKVLGRTRLHPTVRSILSAHVATGGLSIAHAHRLRVMKTWAGRPQAMPAGVAGELR